MALREFECPKCGKKQDFIVSNGKKPRFKHRECDVWMKRVKFSVSNFQLKGSGFHKNDYGKK